VSAPSSSRRPLLARVLERQEVGTVDARYVNAALIDPTGLAGDRDVFVGRRAELEHLDGLLAAARTGQPQLVAIEGPAGIGKTALVQRFLDRTSGRCVLRTRGEQMEATFPYGVVEQLLAGLALPLPAPLDTLRTATERGQDPFAVGAALVDLLGVVQQAGPVVLVVDDAQWADPASLTALVFAFRRLRVDRILTVIVVPGLIDVRALESLRRALADEGGSHLRLSGLAVPELGRLAGELGVDRLTHRALQQLHDHTQGNPLHARALLREVPADTLREVSRPLPAPRSFALLVLRRLASCPAPVVALVAAASVLGGTCLFELAAQLADITEPLVALEQAIAAQLLEERTGEAALVVAFCHPLIRSSVYQALGPAQRARLHARAATLIDDQALALRHRVLAASGADPQLASEVARLARRQRATGAWAGAADGLTAAVRLLRPGRDRERLLLEAVECMLLAGDVAQAVGHAEEVKAVRDVGWREYVLGRLAMVTGRLQEAEANLHHAWRVCEPASDPALGARVAGLLAFQCILEARSLEGVQWANRALHLDPTGAGTDMIRFLQLTGLATGGRPDDALALAAGLPDPAQASGAELDALFGRGMVRTWTDDLAGAHHDLAGLVAATRDRSAAFRTFALTGLAQVEYRHGRWDDALVHAELAVSLARDTDQFWVAVYGHAMAALVLGARGEWSAAEGHVAAAWTASNGPRYPVQVAYAALADAQLRTAQGEPAGVIRALQPLLALEGRDWIDEPGVVPWHDLLADAWVTVGELDKAMRLLDWWEVRAADRGRDSVRAAAARSRGNLEAARGDQAAAERAFQAGLALSDQVERPFDRALLQAAYGAFLRRAGRRAAAAAQLHRAREAFAWLQADPYLERCDRELVGCGLTPTGRQGRDGNGLTPQELAVARLASTGLTNRQVASKLVISVKTVEYHLAKVYTKLAITSRGELGDCLDDFRDGDGPKD
jgi:ATP/maltotriose-dependent transcriptional regulator MalT